MVRLSLISLVAGVVAGFGYGWCGSLYRQLLMVPDLLAATRAAAISDLKLNISSDSVDLISADETDRPLTASRIKFVPYPYRHLGAGDDDAQCTWETKDLPKDSPEAFDLIQRAAYREGICVPSSKNHAKLHTFSSAQAIECLSPTMQGRDIKVMISGDSYNRQLFIGLADILLNRPWNVEIFNGTERNRRLREDAAELGERRRNDPNFPDVQFSCYKECYGDYDNYTMVDCSNCFNELVKGAPDAVPVVGTFVHVYSRLNRSDTATFDEMWGLIENTKQLIYNSGPSYQVSRVPRQYRNASHHHGGEIFYNKLLPLMAPNDPEKPFLDFFQLTRSCDMENCTYDGGHRSRYVNRWKAQLLLNMICSVE